MKGVLHNGMSLFQDLKLKRRKVDSRCSSDGESIGTSDSTASLSPDAQNQNGEGSPKNKERCVTPEELVRSSSGSMHKQDKNGLHNGYSSQTFMFMMKQDRKDLHLSAPSSSKLNAIANSLQSLSNGAATITNSKPTITPTNGVIKMANEIIAAAKNVEVSNTIIDNGFSTKKSRASSLEKISEEAMTINAIEMKIHRKSPTQSSLSNVSSPLSAPSVGDRNSTPPTMSPPPLPASIQNLIKTEKMSKMEVDDDDEADHDQDNEQDKKLYVDSLAMKVKTEPPASVVVGEKRKYNVSPPPSSLAQNSRQREIINRSPGKMSNHSSRSSSPPLPPSTFLIGKHYSGGAGGGENNSRLSPPNSIKSNSRVPSPQELHRQSTPSPNMHHQLPHLTPQQQHLLLSQQSHLHARLLNGPTPPTHHQQHHLHHPDSRIMISSPSSLVHAELRNLAEKPDPLSVVTSTSLSFHHHSMYRINGVRPEVISGGAVTPTSATNNNGSLNNNTNNHHPPNNHILVNGNSGNSNGSSNSISNSSATRKSPSISSNRSPNSSPRSNASTGSIGSNQTMNNTHLSNGSSNHHSQSNHQQQQNLMSAVAGNLAMINSISGQNNANGGGHNHVNLNRTPTVIMGEAGGVRTMLWSQPGVQVDSGQPPPHSQQSAPTTNGHSYGQSASPHHTHSHLTNGHSTSNSSSPSHHLNHQQQHQLPPGVQSISSHLKGGLSMERLWASEALNLSTGANSNGFGTNSSNSNSNSTHTNGSNSFARNNHHGPNNANNSSIPILGGGGHGSLLNGHHHQNSNSGGNTNLHPDDEDYEQPMICMICEDRATGLHYGIITCEGCKGFFKRTVQNRRVYTCVADGTCEITKAQRNRCQYCRFKKCIEQGMVLQAVREDRMPGGRNSGAVYNLYKVPVKYRKHKKGNRGAGGKLDKNSSNGNNIIGSSNNSNSSNGLVSSPGPSPSPQSITGTILKAALTSPNEVNHSRPTSLPFDQAAAMITNLVQCDNFHDIAALQNWEELLEGRGDLSEKLCQMGDSIVYRLVQWTKRLPFYQEVPVDVHTRILTHKWHELLVLTTSAWQAMNTPGPPTNLTIEEEAMENLHILQRCLQAMMGRSLTLEQLRQDVGQMVERLTYLTRSFRRLGIRLEEYVTLKVIAMLQNTGGKSNEVGAIQERYIKCLGTFLEVTCPSHTNRLRDLLQTLPEVQAAASLLLESKMFYVPFLLNSALQR